MIKVVVTDKEGFKYTTFLNDWQEVARYINSKRDVAKAEAKTVKRKGVI